MAEANVVRNFTIGNTRIKIADDYCRKSASEVEETLQRIAERAQWHFMAAATAAAIRDENNADQRTGR